MTNPPTECRTESARRWVVRHLAEPAELFPALGPPRLDTSSLTPADAALALAIYRTTVQRWLTLEHLLNKFLSQKLRKLDPTVQAVLLSGAAQLVFMDRLPGYAVVDQAVGLAKGMGQKHAAGMVNAVLRKVSGLVKDTPTDEPFTPSPARLPMPGGGAVHLRRDCLPGSDQTERYYALAASVPRPLLHGWIEKFGEQEAARLALHSIENPPTIIAVEPHFTPSDNAEHCTPHQTPGFVVWQGPHEALRSFLADQPLRRVQDPASSLAVQSTVELNPKRILDYCAGRGTKTRQLALAHPDATVYATDVDPARLADLRETASAYPNIHVIEPGQAGDQAYDLILLDVPCSNTGVFARRPEARYRYSQQSMGEVIQLQRTITDQAVQWLDHSAGGGHVLYSTCSIDHPENRKQADRLIRGLAEGRTGRVIAEHQQFPQGRGATYCDGSYHCLMRIE